MSIQPFLSNLVFYSFKIFTGTQTSEKNEEVLQIIFCINMKLHDWFSYNNLKNIT